MALSLIHIFILLGRFMVGMGNASYAPVSVSMLTSWTKKSRWGSVIGLYNSSMSVGLAVGTAVAGILAQSIGWRAPFIVMGVVTLQMCIRDRNRERRATHGFCGSTDRDGRK